MAAARMTVLWTDPEPVTLAAKANYGNRDARLDRLFPDLFVEGRDSTRPLMTRPENQCITSFPAIKTRGLAGAAI